jgi:hypothetical protein
MWGLRSDVQMLWIARRAASAPGQWLPSLCLFSPRRQMPHNSMVYWRLWGPLHFFSLPLQFFIIHFLFRFSIIGWDLVLLIFLGAILGYRQWLIQSMCFDFLQYYWKNTYQEIYMQSCLARSDICGESVVRWQGSMVEVSFWRWRANITEDKKPAMSSYQVFHLKEVNTQAWTS